LRTPLVKLKQKGQMTIPAEIRDQLQLRQGDLLEATTDGRSVILTPKALVDREVIPGGEDRKLEVHK
jgi:AbrB family looped-hinge helix DNA binding protein